MPDPTARRRRTAEESRHRILEAAQKRLADEGPEGLRLQELAADLGLSHPAILHHFGSREGLMRALASHGVRGLNEELARRIRADVVDFREILDLTAETLASRGHARLLAWMVLSGRPAGPEQPQLLRDLAELSHGLRTARDTGGGAAGRTGKTAGAGDRKSEGKDQTAYQDTVFSIVLVALALFGDALVGGLIRASAGVDPGPEGAERFRSWLAELLESHLSGDPKPA